MKEHVGKVVPTFGVAALLFLVAACAGTGSYAPLHPEKVLSVPRCSECHDDYRTSFDHDSSFGRNHRAAAARQRHICAGCHRPAFCEDCHAGEEEIRASDKYRDAPGRTFSHRGDYLTQHRIDGKLNPTSCFKCHGRKNDRRCVECHR